MARKHILFTIHGMGDHTGDDWHQEIADTLNQVVKDNKYSYFENRRIEDRIDLVPIK